ncbi:hypothetical protein C8R44DRAFT_754490 [Mycena epipterygia]|nr:hypothetical protein C8R44DRAFT_754490 [Mycena epipterygia]
MPTAQAGAPWARNLTLALLSKPPRVFCASRSGAYERLPTSQLDDDRRPRRLWRLRCCGGTAFDIFCYCDHQLQSFIRVPAAVADTGKNGNRSNRRRQQHQLCIDTTTAFTRPHMQQNLYFRPLHAAAAEWRLASQAEPEGNYLCTACRS